MNEFLKNLRDTLELLLTVLDRLKEEGVTLSDLLDALKNADPNLEQ